MKTTVNLQYSDYETGNLQKSMALERKKREKKLAKERKAMKSVQKVNKRK